MLIKEARRVTTDFGPVAQETFFTYGVTSSVTASLHAAVPRLPTT